MDFTDYDDTALDELRVAVVTEQERRQSLAQIPAQVRDLADRYAAGGGNRDALAAFVAGTT